MTSGALLLGTIKAVVLDEADQLLSEAFYADTAWLLQQLPKRKQVCACLVETAVAAWHDGGDEGGGGKGAAHAKGLV